MAWTCPTRARSTPSTCARSARCWATTAGACNDPAACWAPPPSCQPEKTPPPCASPVCAGASSQAYRSRGWALGSCMLTNSVTDVAAPPEGRVSATLYGGPWVCVEGIGQAEVSAQDHTEPLVSPQALL